MNPEDLERARDPHGQTNRHMYGRKETTGGEGDILNGSSYLEL